MSMDHSNMHHNDQCTWILTEKARLEQQVGALEQNLGTVQETISVVQQELNSVQEKNTSLRDTNGRLDRDITKLKEKNNQLKAKKDASEQRYELVLHALETVCHGNGFDASMFDMDDVRDTIDQVKKLFATYQSHEISLEEYNAEYKHLLQEKWSQYHDAFGLTQALPQSDTEELQYYQQRAAELEAELAAASEASGEASEYIEALKEEIEEFKTEVQHLVIQSADTETRLEEACNAMTAMKIQPDVMATSAGDQITTTEGQVVGDEKRQEHLEQQLLAVKQRLNDEYRNRIGWEEQCSNEKAHKEQLEQRLNSIESEKQELWNKLSIVTQENTTLHSQYQQNHEPSSESAERVRAELQQQFESQMEQAREQNQQLQSQATRLEARVTEITQWNQQLHSQKKELEQGRLRDAAVSAPLQNQVNTLLQEKHDLETQLSQRILLEQRIAQRDQQNEQLQAQNAKLQEENIQTSVLSLPLHTKIEALNAEKEGLENQLAMATQAGEQLQGKMEQMQQESQHQNNHHAHIHHLESQLAQVMHANEQLQAQAGQAMQEDSEQKDLQDQIVHMSMENDHLREQMRQVEEATKKEQEQHHVLRRKAESSHSQLETAKTLSADLRKTLTRVTQEKEEAEKKAKTLMAENQHMLRQKREQAGEVGEGSGSRSKQNTPNGKNFAFGTGPEAEMAELRRQVAAMERARQDAENKKQAALNSMMEVEIRMRDVASTFSQLKQDKHELELHNNAILADKKRLEIQYAETVRQRLDALTDKAQATVAKGKAEEARDEAIMGKDLAEQEQAGTNEELSKLKSQMMTMLGTVQQMKIAKEQLEQRIASLQNGSNAT